MDNNEIRDILKENKEEKYRLFMEKLVDSKYEKLGVRMPYLKKLAKKIAKDNPQEYLKKPYNDYYEEILLQGLVIGNLKEDMDIIFNYVDKFLDKVDNWAICDSLVSGLKICKKDLDKTYIYLEDYYNSEKTYEKRFALVMYLGYFKKEKKYIDDIIEKINNIKSEEYYVQMANAWLISILYKYNKEKIINLLKNNNLDKFTHNKAIQKIIELSKTTKEEKEYLKQYKIK